MKITIFGGIYRNLSHWSHFFRHLVLILSITANCFVIIFGCIRVTKYKTFIVFKPVIGPITVIKCKIVIVCIIVNSFNSLVGVL